MPELGDRVFVRPRAGLSVQRGDGLFGQFLDPQGQEATWDEYLARRHAEGAVLIAAPEQQGEG